MVTEGPLAWWMARKKLMDLFKEYRDRESKGEQQCRNLEGNALKRREEKDQLPG